jgi:hypothetical protein
MVGLMVGDLVGMEVDGWVVGNEVLGTSVGMLDVGACVGETVGYTDGTTDGNFVGFVKEGVKLGDNENEGAAVGVADGTLVVGEELGVAVGEHRILQHVRTQAVA